MTVVGSDGEELGKIDRIEGETMVVRKGFFFPEDHTIPMSAATQADDDNVYLSVTGDAALNQQWGQSQTGMTTSEVADRSMGTASGAGMESDPAPFEHEQDSSRTHVNADDEIRVPVHEEDLTATTRGVERGAVRVDKDVVEEQQELDVPVTEERVNVSRRTVDREATPSDTAFEEGTVEIPVHGEEVDVEKQARVREEVDISRSPETHTERVVGTVRKEEVTVDDASNRRRNRKKKR
jgi:uncharacterized protein (TIGR02271 family)